MTSIRTLTPLFLVGLSGWVGCTDPHVTMVEPQAGVDVNRYTLHLSINPESMYLDGVARLDISFPDSLASLTLQLDESMHITSVVVDGVQTRLTRSGNLLQLALGQGRADSSSTIEISYGGTIGQGVYVENVGEQSVLFSEAWPLRGSGWMPGVHHPSDPAELELTITVPAGYQVVANGVENMIQSEVETGSSWYFSLSDDAPVYTFAFAISDSFTLTQDSTSFGLPINHYVSQAHAQSASYLSRTADVLDTLSALLGPYPYESYSTVEVPMEYAGMENASTSFLAADLYAEPLYNRRNVLEEVNIHEIAHQWFGNDVVPADWRDLWLSEGFATYLTIIVIERMDGKDVARDHLIRLAHLSDRHATRQLVSASYSSPEDLLNETVYQKGASVLHLLRSRVGDEAFFGMLSALRESYREEPLSTMLLQEFWEQSFGQDLESFYSYWIYGEAIPTLSTSWDPQAQVLSWAVENDNGTLEAADFELLIIQDRVEYNVSVQSGRMALHGDTQPVVHSVGVLLDIQRQ